MKVKFKITNLTVINSYFIKECVKIVKLCNCRYRFIIYFKLTCALNLQNAVCFLKLQVLFCYLKLISESIT